VRPGAVEDAIHEGAAHRREVFESRLAERAPLERDVLPPGAGEIDVVELVVDDDGSVLDHVSARSGGCR
jgi:hypothetical protein